jgi:phenylacetate-CoA ligase
MGRADQTAKVKGMFVHPSQINDVVKRHPEIRRARLVVENDGMNDIMTLHCESTGASQDLADAIVSSMRNVCKLRGEICFVGIDSLPNDGVVIEDKRTYE